MNWVVLRIKSSGIDHKEDLDNVYIKCPVCDPHGFREHHLGIHKYLPKYNCFRCRFKGRTPESMRKLEQTIFKNVLAATTTSKYQEEKSPVEQVLNCLHYDLYKDTRFDKNAINRLMKFFLLKEFKQDYFEGLLSIYNKLFESQQSALTPMRDIPDAYKDRLVFFSKDRTWASGRALSADGFPKFKTELLSSAKEMEWTHDLRGTYFPQGENYKTIVMSEGPLDAFALYALSQGREGYRFYSPGGVNLFRGSIDATPREKQVVVITDRDQNLNFFKSLAKNTRRDYYLSLDFFKWPLEEGKDPQDLFRLSKAKAEEKISQLLDSSRWLHLDDKAKRGRVSTSMKLFQSMRGNGR